MPNPLNREFIQFNKIHDGISVIVDGNYGYIALRLSERQSEDGEKVVSSYLLSGVNLKSGRFPGSPEWNERVGSLPTSRWKKKRGGWRVSLPTRAAANEANTVIVGVLKESLKSYRAHKKEMRKRYFQLRRSQASGTASSDTENSPSYAAEYHERTGSD